MSRLGPSQLYWVEEGAGPDHCMLFSGLLTASSDTLVLPKSVQIFYNFSPFCLERACLATETPVYFSCVWVMVQWWEPLLHTQNLTLYFPSIRPIATECKTLQGWAGQIDTIQQFHVSPKLWTFFYLSSVLNLVKFSFFASVFLQLLALLSFKWNLKKEKI